MPGSRVKGFWDLPEPDTVPKPHEGDRPGEAVGAFTHTILHRRYTFTVRLAKGPARDGCSWFDASKLSDIPLSTTARKALRLIYNRG